MQLRGIAVLKFGGSVLLDESSLARAVSEIYRWRRDGWAVVAVASAFSGTTSQLVSSVRSGSLSPDPYALATVVSNGELQSSALLGAQLDRSGIPASVLSPAAVGLEAEGDPLDANPVAIDCDPIHKALGRDEVVVLAGFVARDADGRVVLLGRGGSDLTALFLAHRLRAELCRLIKDVDGLYERDPAGLGPEPRRYEYSTWSDALSTDGSILQIKALRYARTHGIEFELGRLNGTRPTRVGAKPSTFLRAPDRVAPLRVVLLGIGHVGGGVWQRLLQMNDLFEIVAVARRDSNRAIECGVPESLLMFDAVAAAGRDADVVVEAIGGTAVARDAVTAALARGTDVVTANKSLVAAEGVALRALGSTSGAQLLSSAAVGGSLPVLELADREDARDIRCVRGVLNGTTNFILNRIAEGADFGQVIDESRSAGLSEASVESDLSGRDAAEKLCIVAQHLGIDDLSVESIPLEPVRFASIQSAIRGTHQTGVVRQVATLTLDNGDVRGRVALEAVANDDPLAAAPGESNVVSVEFIDGTRQILRGRGAGRWPTAESVMADLLQLSRGRRSGATATSRGNARAN